ncbi:hypothetical protein pqer_cds_662 [Pandoravirus quercus]|uniref:Uncharacterized protein n=1 Tax=Pandoravirus quercus TaxID=2107709 RepID=A0A2U7U9H6_9VIRU|nr:hypothetical protein pqer_cds_662 [Pandoravirus quercus]AVK75084.1 hypothetical protein pqer_cds_662 [Pandoravirus quercus]
MDTTATVRLQDNRQCTFEFDCKDALLILHVDRVARLFPSYSLVGALLTERWAPRTVSARRGVNCTSFTARAIRLILRVLTDLGPTTETAPKLWKARDDFIAACDFLLLHHTAAGQVAADLRAIADAVIIKVAYSISPGRRPSSCDPMAHITVHVQPCHLHWPALRGALFGLDPSHESLRRPLIVGTHAYEVSTPCDVVKAARDIASAWSITSPRRIACAALRKESLFLDEYFSCDEEDRGDDYDEDTGAIVAFCPMGVYRDPVVMPIDGVQFVDPSDALPLRKCIDPVCALEPWRPAHHDPSTILVVGGTRGERMEIASDLARAMGHTQAIILATRDAPLDDSTFARFDNVTITRDAIWVDPTPDGSPVVIVDESFPGDARLLPSIWSARRRRCRTIVMTDNSRVWDETRFDTVLGHCDTITVGALMKRCRRSVPPNLVRSCARRGSAFGASISLVFDGTNVIGTYTSGDKAALEQCDTCTVSRPHAAALPVVAEPLPPRKVRPGQSPPPVGGNFCKSCMEPLEYATVGDMLFLQCPLCGCAPQWTVLP